jgi:UDP-N-acetylglucosamine 1-carboxyvinyltransferase
MDVLYRMKGGISLRGDVTVSGSKNAALPLIASTLLTDEEVTLTNVPRLRDTEVMLDILRFLGAQVHVDDTTVKVRTNNVRSKPIPSEYTSKVRGSIVLLGPMLARFGVVEMAYPGGDVIGKRPIRAHTIAFQQMGAQDMSTEEIIHLQGKLTPTRVILPEFSVTATENLVMAAALLPGETRIDLAAAEPHVQDIEQIVQEMGATVEGMGTHSVVIRGNPKLKGVQHAVIPDYLEAGTLIAAALVSKGKVRIHKADREHLLSFLDAVRRFGGIIKEEDGVLFVDGELSSLQAMTIRTNIYPGFPTDLQATMGVAMTQAKGVSRLFERLYEGRMAYLYELEKMGAHIEVMNAHQALIIGPTPLRGRVVASNDVRAGAAMVLAALCAEGDTTITDVRYIERGYDRLDEKLRNLGAKIDRQTTDPLGA